MNRRIEPLTPRHDRAGFQCGKPWLDRYIQQFALRNQQLGYGKTYVVISDDAPRVVEGYYTLSMGSVLFAELPDELAQRVPKYPMPVAHIGCLAVSSKCQRQGLGGLLLVDAMRRILTAVDIVAARALEVRAIDDEARDWYVKYGFAPFRDAPLHLYLPMETVRQLVEETS